MTQKLKKPWVPNRQAFEFLLISVAVTAGLLLPGCQSGPSVRSGGEPGASNLARIILPDASIQGQPASLALDTGASTTALFSSAAERLGLKVFPPPPGLAQVRPGVIAPGLSEPVEVKVGREILTAQLPVYPQTGPGQRLAGEDSRRDGLIGWPEVKGNLLQIDAARRTIKVLDSLPADLGGWMKLKVRPDPILLLEIPQPDGTTSVIVVDTGSPMGLTVPPPVWLRRSFMLGVSTRCSASLSFRKEDVSS